MWGEVQRVVGVHGVVGMVSRGVWEGLGGMG